MTNQIQINEDLKNFEEDSDWFYKNIEILRKKEFNNKYVAIKGKQVIASGDKVEIVIQKIEKQNQNPSFIFIGFVYPKGYILLL